MYRFIAATVAVLALPFAAQAQTETPEYYVTDTIGSIRAVFDAGGTVKARLDYGPFGQELASNQGAPEERFAGQAKDGETDQGDFHARILQNRTGRFTRPDFMMSDPSNPQRWNRYVYALNNPLSIVDPDGADPCAGWISDTSTCVTGTSPNALPYKGDGGGG